jgi:hypothetical protein
LTKTKQSLFSIIIKIFLLWFISACAYEPKTLVKTPRTSLANKTSHIKTTNSIELKLNIPPLNNKARAEKRVPALPIIGINFSNFKRNLIGLNEFEIIELLDKPSFKRTEHPASIWQYQSSICFLDIFFFPIKQNMVVDYIDIRGKNITRAEEKLCFSSLLDTGEQSLTVKH